MNFLGGHRAILNAIWIVLIILNAILTILHAVLTILDATLTILDAVLNILGCHRVILDATLIVPAYFHHSGGYFDQRFEHSGRSSGHSRRYFDRFDPT